MEKGMKTGFNAIWLLGVPTFLTIFIFIILNNKIRENNFISLPEFLKYYYGEKVSYFASYLVLFYMVMLAASQFVAWGKFISVFINTNYELTIIIGGFVVILYSFLGGYLSVIFTDAVQFVLISSALIYLFFHSNKSMEYLKSEDFNIFDNFSLNILIVISFTLAWTISPIIWQRIASAKSVKAARSGLFFSLIALIIIYLVIIISSISLRQYGLNIELGGIVFNYLPKFGSMLVFIGIASAIMSTADSALNIGSLTLTKDIFKKDKDNVIYAKIFTALCGIFAIIISIGFTSIIKTLGLASEIMAEGFFIPGMAALIFKIKNPLSGILSLTLGGGFSILVFLNEYGLKIPVPDWPYSLPFGISLSLSGFLIGLFVYKIKKN
jgi:SSS family solute:Na+ symporter